MRVLVLGLEEDSETTRTLVDNMLKKGCPPSVALDQAEQSFVELVSNAFDTYLQRTMPLIAHGLRQQYAEEVALEEHMTDEEWDEAYLEKMSSLNKILQECEDEELQSGGEEEE